MFLFLIAHWAVTLACPDHDGGGCCQPQSAGASDDDNGDAKEQSNQEAGRSSREPVAGICASHPCHAWIAVDVRIIQPSNGQGSDTGGSVRWQEMKKQDPQRPPELACSYIRCTRDRRGTES